MRQENCCCRRIFDFIATFNWVCLLSKQISTQPKKETMKTYCLILLVIVILAPTIAAIDCSGETQSTCGVAGTTCRYYTWNNGTCVPLSTCPTNTTVTVWSNATQNCEECFGSTSSSICSSCAPYDFYFDTGASVCTTCANKYGSSCLTCDSAGCKTCSTGLSLTTDKQSCFNGTCNITYCIKCSNTTACETCDSTRTLVNGFCVCQIANCEVCSKGFCDTCNPGYALDSSKKTCNFVCITNCQTCTNLQSCTTCFSGYYYSSTSNQCLPNCTTIDANCISCSSTTICSACSTNFTLAASRTSCVAPCTDSNCLTCASSSSVCTQCKTGFKVTTFNNCSSDVCSISNCITCASATTCTTCSSLYTLSSDKKTCAPNCGDTNCIYCSSLTACQTCTNGYRISSGKCVALCSISNCMLCSTTSTCQTCNGGFLLSADSQSCQFNCKILNCISCASSTTCSTCYPGYLLNNAATACLVQCSSGKYSLNNVCVSCLDANCATCNSNGVCLSCLDTYYLLSNGTCVSCGFSSTNATTNCYNCDQGTGTCQICNNNFYLDSTSKCVAYGTCNVDNCQYCQTTNSSSCISCFSGYTLAANSSACTQLTCSGNQFLVGDVCTCGSKSYLDSGSCVACSDVNCLTCTSTSCLSCLPKYYASGTTCVACGTNCDTCDSTGCITCTTGYLKSNGSCIEPPTTKPVSVSSSGATIICPTGCSTCDLDTNSQLTCRVAADGYALSLGKIYACDTSCATCSNTPDSSGKFTNCLTCPTGSNFIAGICTKCTGANALTCRHKNYAYSLTCIPGYTAQKGTCNACAANCKKCNSVGSLSANPTKVNVCDRGGCVEDYFQSKSSTSCVKCFNGCHVCSSDPRVCLDCGDYKYLLNNICYSCTDNCVKCTSTGCTSCEVGYLVSSDGTCKTPNIDGCVSYTAAITCQTCDLNYNLVNGNCELSIACNANKTCENCKYNYYLSSGTCLLCPTIANCNSCNVIDSTKCIDCATGYYLNSASICTACPQAGCSSCTSETVCKTAKDGYYLLVDISGKYTGGVKPCQGYCATCKKNAHSCLTCQSGATLYGSTCISDKKQNIKFVGNLKALGSQNVTSEYEVGSAIDVLANLLTEMATALGYSSLGEFLQNVNVKGITRASVNLNYEVNTDSIKVENTNTALTSTTFSDLTLLSLDVASSTATTSSNVNLGLVLGVSIPLGVLLVAIIIILKVKSAKADEDQSGLDGTEKDIENAPAQQF